MSDQPAEQLYVPPPPIRPAIWYNSIEFSDGTNLRLQRDDVVVLVGPNNAGKSAALRELVGGKAGFVIKTCDTNRTGNVDDLRAWLAKHRRPDSRGVYRGYGYVVGPHEIGGWGGSNPWETLPFFCALASTDERLTASNPVDSYNIASGHASQVLHLLAGRRDLEKRLSSYFRRAFGTDLIFFNEGHSWSLRVGERPPLADGEERTDLTYIEKVLASTRALQSQGDGMRAFATMIITLLMEDRGSMLMLDEPEAFLHPPQARLIGEFIAKELRGTCQIFVATHSPDVLVGLLGAAPDGLRVMRLQRNGDINRTKELDKARAAEIANDPLMKYSNVLSGMFHQRVIICESDADCMFYGALLDLPEIHGDQRPDVLFLHASGKHRMCQIANALRALDVTVDVVADIDILDDLQVMQKLVTALGGDWGAIKQDAATLKHSVETSKPILGSADIAAAIEKALASRPVGETLFPEKTKKEIASLLKRASPWDAIKGAGAAAFANGHPTKQWNQVEAACRRCGIWIVPVGELENFDKATDWHGPKWVQAVLEKYDLATAPQLQSARAFVKELWERPSDL